ncbi:MAG TPA: glycosyltransferase [Fimbriimonadaceae bacterium]|nr:glycosyltransferase [Fimbriimonadaceae bacterium]
MSAPTVSVVIPCYNGAATLAEAIESALAQTYSPLEVVVVDDGSTDESARIASRYDSVLVVQQSNGGLSAARNAGIARSSGEWILLLDADDRLLPDCASARLELAREHPFVTGHVRLIDEQGRVLREPPPRAQPTGDPLSASLRSNYGPPSGWLFSRRVYELCGPFDPLLRSCEDWDFLIRASARFSFTFDPVARVEYRVSPGAMSLNFLTMIDAAAQMFRKNRMLRSSAVRYRFESAVGMKNHCARAVFGRLFREEGIDRPLARLAAIVLRRPKVIPYLIIWAFEAGYNRLFGRSAWRGRMA